MAVTAFALRWSPDDAVGEELRLVGQGALTGWGVDELARGHNPMRHTLGAVVLGWQAWSLLSLR